MRLRWSLVGAFLAGLLASGTLRVPIDGPHPMTDFEVAFRRLDLGAAQGKIVLRVLANAPGKGRE